MILKRCASAAPTTKLTVESTSTFGLPDFNGFAAGRLLPNTLILREGGSRYTTESGIKIPDLIPANDLGRRIPTEFRRRSVSGSRAALLRAHFSGRRPIRPFATQSGGGLTSYRTTDRWGAAAAYLGAAGVCTSACFAAVDTSLPVEIRNWTKSRPLAMTRPKVDPPCRRRWRGSRSERPTAPGMAVFRFRWCRFRGQCCIRGYARGRALGVGKSAAAPWLSSSHSLPAVFPHSAILTSCRRR